MKKIFLIALGALFVTAAQTFASDELNNEDSVTNVEMRALAKDLPATVVVRVNKDDNSVAVFQSKDELAANASSKETVLAANFTAMGAKDTLSEIDQDGSSKAWYQFYFNYYNYYYPSYNYYGYNYNYSPYYSYNYNNYYYYYYWYRW